MKKYKGYYIDNIVFHSAKEIDEFLKKRAIEYFKFLCQYFAKHSTLEASTKCSEQALTLHELHGLPWCEIETIEIEAITA